MITVSFQLEGARILGFSCQGHSGLAPEGEDILCAAVSSAVRMAECAINDVAGIGACVTVNEEKAEVTLRLPKEVDESKEDACQIVLIAMMVSLARMQEEFPENITVLEV